METKSTETAVTIVDETPRHLPAKRSLFDMEPDEQIAKATQIANALVKVIEKQVLYTNIQGKKYVRVEGWELLGTFLGILPKERSIVAHPDGSYEATVDLVRATDGIVIGGASAICGVDEKRWANAERYARRSMAFTRAVGKAYRSSFSWIISLAGYEVTPAEEIPRDEKPAPRPSDTRQANTRESKVYSGETVQQEAIQAILREKKVPEEKWNAVHERMLGKPGHHLPKIISEVNQ